MESVSAMSVDGDTKEVMVQCRVCHGTGLSKYTGMKCGGCGGSGEITAEADRAKRQIAEDLRRRVLGF